jgi:hypothetical protein
MSGTFLFVPWIVFEKSVGSISTYVQYGSYLTDTNQNKIHYTKFSADAQYQIQSKFDSGFRDDT